jgi:hypothetical protein
MARRKYSAEQSRVVRYFHTPYERAVATVSRHRARLLEDLRAALGYSSAEAVAAAVAVDTQYRLPMMTFDEALFFNWEESCREGEA